MDPADRQDQIIKVAAEHFAKDGITGASISAIAHDAGVARALVYHYFPGRDALLEAVLRAEAERLLHATRPDFALSPRQNLNRALAAYLDFFATSSGGVREPYNPAHAVPTVRELAHTNHQHHIQWIFQCTEQPDTPRNRLAIGGWLAFVEFTARHSIEVGELAPNDVIEICIAALEGALHTVFTEPE